MHRRRFLRSDVALRPGNGAPMTVVAIDGPAGAGKSSVARALARRLGFRFLDTGAMYRAVALAALEAGIDLDDGRAVTELMSRITIDPDGDRVTLDGRDVSAAIRTRAVTSGAAKAARHQAVRAALAEAQRALARDGDVVVEGRDIGSEVLPDADLKIFLTASLEERAKRRSRESSEALTPEQLLELQRDLERRDESDRTRPLSPLVQAPGAVVVDSTGLSQEEVVDLLVSLVRGDPARPVA